MQKQSEKTFHTTWRNRLYEIIFEADTPAGRRFDIALLIAILLSIVVVMLESVSSIQANYGDWLRTLEWFFTFLFTAEYLARLIAVRNPRRYIFSFLGIIDFLAIIPTYLSIVFVGSQYLLVIRTIRLLRIFRILKLSRYLGEATVLTTALKASRHKIVVFLLTVVSIVIIAGTLMYLVEGPENGFTSIPISIYWSIVTLTTVGYGDIAPKTVLGQALASFIMITGYGIIAVPTGIVTSELSKISYKSTVSTQTCPNCLAQDHDTGSAYCKHCGTRLNP
ncbi:ion transporter [Rhodocytophaga aerolata]|uniref:Ion transporter n=1 Tax=Rhodocytophaga aerolata TaxID=455078 RepID=A0ABT8RCT6_9BACT|nr:ion transporter [Rhodocytophaga aerolata]MDO1449139.1 ion transporter [Rhodocytophaga aerolata]